LKFMRIRNEKEEGLIKMFQLCSTENSVIAEVQ